MSAPAKPPVYEIKSGARPLGSSHDPAEAARIMFDNRTEPILRILVWPAWVWPTAVYEEVGRLVDAELRRRETA